MRRPPIAPSKANERSGECIYHQQGGRWYAKINMGSSKGKRWFCSVQEAEAAGCGATKQ
jgi:ribosomal protein L27